MHGAGLQTSIAVYLFQTEQAVGGLPMNARRRMYGGPKIHIAWGGFKRRILTSLVGLAGPIADAVGINPWYVVGGLTCIVIAGVGVFLRPVLSIEDHQQEGAAAVGEAVAVPVEAGDRVSG